MAENIEEVAPESTPTAVEEVANDGMEVTTPESEAKALQESQNIQESKPESKEEVKEEVKDGKETENKPVKKSRSQRSIERQNEEIKRLKQEKEDLLAKQKEQKKELENPKPNIDDFLDIDDYKEALTTYETNLKEQESKPDEVKEDAKTDIKGVLEDGKEDYEDFEALVMSPDLPLTDALLNEVLDTDNPSDLLYYLAKDKQLTSKIAQLPTKQMIKELAKAEIAMQNKQVQSPVAKKVTQAPKPIEPIETGREPIKDIHSENLSFNDYEAIRRQQTRNSW